MAQMQKVRTIMSLDPVCMSASSSATAAARVMRDADIGNVIVRDDGEMFGIVTDRDITVRLVAERGDPDKVTLGNICSQEMTVVSPDDHLDTVVELMGDRALRRVPVVEDGYPVGILSLGDLAMLRTPDSVLAAISAAPGNS